MLQRGVAVGIEVERQLAHGVGNRGVGGLARHPDHRVDHRAIAWDVGVGALDIAIDEEDGRVLLVGERVSGGDGRGVGSRGDNAVAGPAGEIRRLRVGGKPLEGVGGEKRERGVRDGGPRERVVGRDRERRGRPLAARAVGGGGPRRVDAEVGFVGVSHAWEGCRHRRAVNMPVRPADGLGIRRAIDIERPHVNVCKLL